MKTWEFDAKVANHCKKHPSQRVGQAIFNVAWETLGQRLNPIIGTNKDPFFVDDNIQAFYSYLNDSGFFAAEGDLTSETKQDTVPLIKETPMTLTEEQFNKLSEIEARGRTSERDGSDATVDGVDTVDDIWYLLDLVRKLTRNR